MEDYDWKNVRANSEEETRKKNGWSPLKETSEG